MLKISLRFKQTLRVNNSRIIAIKNAKFSGYCLYINLNIYGDFQIGISLPLMLVLVIPQTSILFYFDFLIFFFSLKCYEDYFLMNWVFEDLKQDQYILACQCPCRR